MTYRAVIFDLGGVVLGSPLQAIAAYEARHGLPDNAINRVVVDTGPEGAWSRLERGEVSLPEFFAGFDAECAAAGHAVSTRDLMAEIHAASAPRPAMLHAVTRIRANGLATAALTNNWAGDGVDSTGGDVVRDCFDIVVESAVEGLRKPDPRIYELTCERLAVAPSAAIFLDDIGRNLKTARALGMTTLKVAEPDAALDELGALLGFVLA